MNQTMLGEVWLRFRFYHHVYHGVLGAVSVAINIFVARIIITRTPQQIIQYSRVLFLSCLVNIGVASFLFIDHNIMIISKEGLYIIPNGFFRDAPLPIIYFLSSLHTFCFSFTLAMIPLPFVYRYFYLCRNKILTNYELFQLAVVCYIPCFIYVAIGAYTRIPLSESQKFTENFKEFQWLDPENDEIMVIQKANSPEFKTMTSVIITLLIILYATVLICSWKIYQRLQNTKKFRKTLKLQNQLTRTLTFQAITPVVFMLGPMVIATVCMIFQKGSIAISILITALVELYPLADPLGCIFFVKPYYIAIIGKRKKLIRKQNGTVNGNTEQNDPLESSEGFTSSV